MKTDVVDRHWRSTGELSELVRSRGYVLPRRAVLSWLKRLEADGLVESKRSDLEYPKNQYLWRRND